MILWRKNELTCNDVPTVPGRVLPGVGRAYGVGFGCLSWWQDAEDKMIWTDENGNHHWIVNGYHYVAMWQAEPAEWTLAQEQAARMYLMFGYLAVILLVIVDAFGLWIVAGR